MLSKKDMLELEDAADEAGGWVIQLTGKEKEEADKLTTEYIRKLKERNKEETKQ